MAKFLSIKESEKFVGQSEIELSGGKKLIIEAAEGPEDALIVSRSIVAADGQTILTLQECYCGGQYIGSADCPGNRIDCNCVSKTVGCY